MVRGWLRRLDDDVLGGRAASRLSITLPLCLLTGAVVLGGAGFVSGVYAALALPSDGYGLPYLGAVLGALVGGGLGVLLALRHGGRVPSPTRPPRP